MDIGQLLIYIVVGSLGIAWIVAVWRMSGVWSIILPAVTSVSYLLQLGCAYFDWYSLANFFWYLTLFLGVVCFLVFFAPIFNGLASEERRNRSSNNHRKQEEYNARHWYFHNPNSTYNRYINPHSPTYKK